MSAAERRTADDAQASHSGHVAEAPPSAQAAAHGAAAATAVDTATAEVAQPSKADHTSVEDAQAPPSAQAAAHGAAAAMAANTTTAEVAQPSAQADHTSVEDAQASAQVPEPAGDEAGGDEDEAQEGGEEECAFCVFMRGGGCGQVFRAWEACVDKHREDVEGFAVQCSGATQILQECMERPENRAYYSPMLEEEAEFVREQTEKQQQLEAEAAAAEVQAERADGRAKPDR